MGSSRDRGVARESRGESGRIGESQGARAVGLGEKRRGDDKRERGKERQRRGREFKGICGIRGDPVKD